MDNFFPSFPDNDTDSISDDSRKIRKQRNTYQKIPDDIRVQLLECVKNGETLKAAAKRFKVNYSSAKSILHTYRKEGRILKKAAQERVIKKKDDNLEEDTTKVATKPSKATKKEKVKIITEDLELPHPSAERTASMTTCATLSDVYRPALSDLGHCEDLVDTLKDQHHVDDKKVLHEMAIVNLMSQDHHESHTPSGTGMKRSLQLMDSFFSQPDFHFPESGIYSTIGETTTTNNNNSYLNNNYNVDDYSSFNDMMNAFQRKASFNGDIFNDCNGFLVSKGLTPVNNQDKSFKFENNENLGHHHFKSFLDTQNLLREAFRKGSISRLRKNSFDMF